MENQELALALDRIETLERTEALEPLLEVLMEETPRQINVVK